MENKFSLDGCKMKRKQMWWVAKNIIDNDIKFWITGNTKSSCWLLLLSKLELKGWLDARELGWRIVKAGEV